MNALFRIASLTPLVVMLFAAATGSAAEPPKSATHYQIKKELAAKKAVLVDVREQSEWDAGHIDGAMLLPMSVLEGLDAEALAKKLPKDKKIYTYCRVGRRADMAAERLAELGFRAEVALSGGYEKLLEAGFKPAPVKKGSQ